MEKHLAALASAALVLGVLAGSGAPAPPPAAAGSCSVRWGSLNEGLLQDDGYSVNTVKGVRTGRHACFDRLVVDVRGDIDGYWVGYAEGVPGHDAYGRPASLRGGAALLVDLHNPSLTRAGRPSWAPGVPRELTDVSGYRTFRQVALSGYGSEDGYRTRGDENWTALALGLRARLPFRTFVLPGPGSGQRLVIDVAHRW